MRVENSEFCFLTDQLHLFAADRTMYWDDWNLEVHPLNLVQGTLLGSKAALGRYPPLARGEDTPLILDLLRRGRRITRLREHGYLYVYVFDGQNAWDYEHHATISAWKRFRGARLLALEPMLRARLAEYEPPLGRFVMPYESGTAGLRRRQRWRTCDGVQNCGAAIAQHPPPGAVRRHRGVGVVPLHVRIERQEQRVHGHLPRERTSGRTIVSRSEGVHASIVPIGSPPRRLDRR